MQTEALTEFTSKPERNYAGKYQTSNHKFIPCYTISQIKNLYPQGGYTVHGEFAPGSPLPRSGSLRCDGLKLRLSAAHSNSRLLYAEKGFVSLEGIEDGFAILLKNALLQRLLAAALCLALIAGGILLASNWDSLFAAVEAGSDTPGRELELEEGAEEWQGVQPRDTGGVTQGIAIPGYKSITIDADTADVKVNFQNPEGNPCYFVISLVLADGTELYKSKMIEPGMGLYEITLTQALAAGEYDATVKYETFGLESLSPMNGAEVKIKLIAE
jgi:hypothetical protein